MNAESVTKPYILLVTVKLTEDMQNIGKAQLTAYLFFSVTSLILLFLANALKFIS